MDDARKWSISSNDALHISLKHPHDEAKDAEFEPSFTYPIYGNEETIFGYQNLRINLNFHASTLQPEIEIGWSGKFESVGETAADDVEEPLKPYLPTIYDDTHNASAPEEAASFQPPGELVHQYEVNGRSFGIWAALLTDPTAKRIVRHMQILVPLFIEGGTCIELDDPEWTIERWRVFFLYEIDAQPTTPNDPSYLFAGYSTAYRLFFLDAAHPDYYQLGLLTSPTSQPPNPASQHLTGPSPQLARRLPCRQRISQFLITPPYQRSSHGYALYTTIVNCLLSIPTTAEITVEDPNESFDALRDTSDLHRLRTNIPAFTTLALRTSSPLPPSTLQKNKPIPFSSLLPTETITTIRSTTRLAPRQLARLLEMQLLSTIPPRHRSTSRITRKSQSSDANDRAYYFWRLMVKERLFRHNRDVLMQVEGEERVERVEETVAGVEREYQACVERVEKWMARERREAREAQEANDGEGDTKAGAQMLRKAKRKIVDEDEDYKDTADGAKASGVNGVSGTSLAPEEEPPRQKTGSGGGSSKRQKTAEPDANGTGQAGLPRAAGQSSASAA